MEDAEREARETAVAAVRPFGDAEDGPDIGETQGGALRIRHYQQPEVWIQFCEAKDPAIEKMGQSGTVAVGLFRYRDEVDGQEDESKLHILRLIEQ